MARLARAVPLLSVNRVIGAPPRGSSGREHAGPRPDRRHLAVRWCRARPWVDRYRAWVDPRSAVAAGWAIAGQAAVDSAAVADSAGAGPRVAGSGGGAGLGGG